MDSLSCRPRCALASGGPECILRAAESRWPLCAAAGLAFAALLWHAREPGLVLTAKGTVAGGPPRGSLSAVGTALFTQFTLPFELASLILLAAIVGAVVVAKKRTES